MILKASARGGGANLSAHLLKEENEHVEVHDIRGFMANDLPGALKEAQAASRGTKCQKYLFHVSLNPPETESVSIEAFEAALEKIEQANGLSGQPRAVVFHEKEGRRHCHAVYSRIDAETMKAIPLPFFKFKLREVSRELYLEHGWQMPRGLVNSQGRDPRNFTLAEWQAAKRAGEDPRQLKQTIQECWAAFKDGPAFAKALRDRGLYLAKGDTRGHVAVTYQGQVVSVARMIGKRGKDVAARLGDPKSLATVADTRKEIAETIKPKLAELMKAAKFEHRQAMKPLEARRDALKVQHAAERKRLEDGQRARSILETRARAARLRTGTAGIWDRLTGTYAKTRKLNEVETFACFRRDRAQRNDLGDLQMKDRRDLQADIRAVRHRYTSAISELHADLAKQRDGQQAKPDGLTQTFRREATKLRRTGQTRGEVRSVSRGPSLGL